MTDAFPRIKPIADLIPSVSEHVLRGSKSFYLTYERADCLIWRIVASITKRGKISHYKLLRRV